MDKPWRTVILEEAFAASLQEEQMLLQGKEDNIRIPIYQIREIVFSSGCGSISIPLLEALIQNHVLVLFCDQRRFPVGKLCEVGVHFESAGRVMDQAKWTMRRKMAIWKQIVKVKISTEIELLQRLGISVPDKLYSCKKDILSDDSSNREAVAAKFYFSSLFGEAFIRFESDDINAALNYGYTILCSAFCRTIAMHGYCTEIGIHHCNRQNSFNLACDLMEPFRAFVDEVVWNRRYDTFDFTYRKELISVLHKECVYDGKRVCVSDAIESFTLDVLSAMGIARKTIKEVGFCDA